MSEDITKKKLSKRDLVMRMILAALVAGLLSAWGYSIYQDYQDSNIKGYGDTIPDEHLKHIGNPDIGRGGRNE